MRRIWRRTRNTCPGGVSKYHGLIGGKRSDIESVGSGSNFVYDPECFAPWEVFGHFVVSKTTLQIILSIADHIASAEEKASSRYIVKHFHGSLTLFESAQVWLYQERNAWFALGSRNAVQSIL